MEDCDIRDIIMLSGGFDPIHPGHIDMINKAAEIGPVFIILNSDAWLIRKKGFFFQDFNQRKAILSALANVDGVVAASDDDGTVCKTLEQYKPGFFGNGGDRKADNTPEVELCNRLGIKLVWNLENPITKNFHSSFFLSKKRVERSWGYYDVLLDEPHIKVKKLVVYPGQFTSTQYHSKRTEHMFYPDGKVTVIEPYVQHLVRNDDPKHNLEIIEVQQGECMEEDIVRIPTEWN